MTRNPAGGAVRDEDVDLDALLDPCLENSRGAVIDRPECTVTSSVSSSR